MMFYRIVIIYFCLLLFSSCGFKLADRDNRFEVAEINTFGDKKINYKLKNKISNKSSKGNGDVFNISLNTKKIKLVKEKNISNQVTKNEINIIVNVEYKSLSKGTEGEFSISKKGDYSVSSKYSDTLRNEKNLISNLINDIEDEFFENLSSLNDL